MYLLKCPDVIGSLPNFPLIFLGGGITNCPDWQATVIDALKDEDCILINPRRDGWDSSNPNMERQQIEWEHEHLEMADKIIFWFPKETLCPITLFELGKHLAPRFTRKELHIGCHPEYARKNDVRIQVGLERKNQIIHNSLDDLIKEVALKLI